ncbi:hypothetical protein HYPSUDRAFT_140843 [Hypholoma sublateritium FD-334 SS-4]|uniref:Uncharacterized protein n=1 Tax=Hypholoma sublateritium (strain FD-334 SS-4) TaxID=945553 RepID=A0A0D2PN61_HYPSF|nr:hypothetical protein HYPSUDRAFT_140843 [Hypholoma sublateritium FD-334 SS-4]
MLTKIPCFFDFTQFIELASAIGDRVPGPCYVTVNPLTQNDMLSIVEAAHRLHRTFTEQSGPRELIVSIPATEAGILAAQALEREGILTSLYLVTSLVHAQACVEAGVSAISVSARSLLDLYERKRKTVYQEPNNNPGIEVIQTIVAYFKHNNIRTTVTVTDFRSVAEIGLLSECDAVCVSEEQAARLKWSQVPTALHYSEQPRVRLRAEQAKYPTNLLTRKGGFSTWFSPQSRSLTMDILHDALQILQKQMIVLEHVVEEEIIRYVKLEKQSGCDSSKMMEADGMWPHLSTTSADGKEVETFSLSNLANNSIVMDEVF